MQKDNVTKFFEHFNHGSEVLRAEAAVSFSGFDPALGRNAIPDTACRRTLIGSYTLRQLEQHLLKQGKIIMRRNESNEFRCGNNGTLISKEVAIIPACVNRRRILIRVSILPDSGCLTPLLLSKEFLRDLGTEIDMNRDVVVFRALGIEIKLGETQRGHYAIPMFDFFDECFGIDEPDGKCKNERIFNIIALELGERSSPEQRSDPAVPCNESDGGCRGDEDDGECQGYESKIGHDPAGVGCSTRSSGRRPSLPDARRDDHQGGQVRQTWCVMNVAKQYESDKGYVEWIRNHINSRSSMEIQRLRIYIYQRDAQKRERLMQERTHGMTAERPAWMESPSHTGVPVMSGPPSSCWSHVSMPEIAGHRRQMMRRTPEQQKEILENWENMVRNLGQNYLLKENQMAMHFNAMHPKTLARFMMNMITY